MATGRSIRLFLVDGTPTGIITAEIMNWTGHVLSAPRNNLPQLLKRNEANRSGVYFLVGPNPENPAKSIVYIGESDNVSRRLISHNNDSSKEFWDKTFIITSKDQNLTKAHVRYLESKLISITAKTGNIKLVNGTAPECALPEADTADMEFFVEQIRIVMPVLGMEFLREKPSASEQTENSETKIERSPIFEIYSPKYKLSAKARQVEGDFIVLSGSHARSSWESAAGGYKALHEQLVEDQRLVPERDGILYFKEDTIFSSPSAASATIFGRPDNGRTTWRVQGTSKTYADWQNEQISSSSLETTEVD